MLQFFNPLPLLITISALFGVLFHDTQFDKAAVTTLTVPVGISDFGSAETALKMSNDLHIHTERVSVSSSLPLQQPRGSDDKKYILNKRFALNTSNSNYEWPIIE